MNLRAITVLAFMVVMPAFAKDIPDAAESGKLDFFERKVRPLLSLHCYECHSEPAKTIHGGLRLDSADSIERGGDSGPLVVKGNSAASLLIQTVRQDGEIEMPPKGRLTDREISILTKWVDDGAFFPDAKTSTAHPQPKLDLEAGREFWSFQPIQAQKAPTNFAQPNWPRNRIDKFVLAAMEREGLHPSDRADRSTLIRRAAYALTGLPPSPADVGEFVNSQHPEVYRRMVDRYLNSPQYGEKWGRWWLDMARYTDRTANWLYQTGQAHLYRDWVVQAFCEDMPYDDFVRRQLATDLMPNTGPEDLPALGFLSLSPTYWKELKLPSEIIKVIVADEWEERVDAVSRTFLGLTVACARCHDHKFDPISTEDYYALAGIFASCRQVERPIVDQAIHQKTQLAKQQVAKWKEQIEIFKKEDSPPKQKIAEFTTKIDRLIEATPFYDSPMANALSEESMHVVQAGKTPQQGTKLVYQSEPRDLPAFIRGNPNRPGPVIKRRFLTILDPDQIPYKQGSGRLELAESILHDGTPLSARVLVNRIWNEHFGTGIVSTPSNFGQQGARPSHPELLDDLADRFISNGWSIKHLHREILLSATWQQSSSVTPNRFKLDPSNRWLSRMVRRRINFEEWRDSILAASGSLDHRRGGISIDLDAENNQRRTIYGTVHRRDMSTTLMVHDFPDPTQHSPQRAYTITPLQGLYALNGPLLIGQAKALATRLNDLNFSEHLATELTPAVHSEAQRIHYLYQQLFTRDPTERELTLAEAFLSTGASEPNELWEQYIHVLLASNEVMFVD
ncbi:MAG: PSD1 and planctomycete cytochrome C domain-containing protein [Rubripirellula sp.]|nr:PSD1 and planctomycete cytochrome C domain-containing protein [Rubripirellula sp.]